MRDNRESSDTSGSENEVLEELKPTRPDIFSGKLGVKEALNKLRGRLLDLSARNRLLNFKHSRTKSLQFVGIANLDGHFERLLDGKSVSLAPVPSAQVRAGQAKADVLEQARDLGIPTSADLPDPVPEPAPGRRGYQLQTLLFPDDLERFARKTSSNAGTIIEETGSNMLFLVFGFLEWYESDESERAMLAPLLAVPVGIQRGKVDPQTNIYQYSLAHTGEDVTDNHTLREKLKQDFRLILPTFGEEDTPESYFKAVAEVVRTKDRWRVRRQLSLAMLSFGKMAIWADLDPAQWPDLVSNRLLKTFFAGNSGQRSEGLEIAPDYAIDQHPKVDLALIFDADSSQHSALIDALDGRDMVINGPPGTGKSQTITNLIAAAIASGKKVLFVSEKLAALEVVRKRLDRAGLGHFCLELHSHKTQKKKFIEEIQARVAAQFPAPKHVEGKLAALGEQRKRLQRHMELLSSKTANQLDRTVGEILWLAERRRQQIGDQDRVVAPITIPGADLIGFKELEQHRAKLRDLAERYLRVGGFGPAHPWWGFEPHALAPGDEEAIRALLSSAESEAARAQEAAEDLLAYSADSTPMDVESLSHAHAVLSQLGEVPECVMEPLLQILGEGPSTKRKIRAARTVLERLKVRTSQLRELRQKQRIGLHTPLPDGAKTLDSVRRLIGADKSDGPILALGLLELDIQQLAHFWTDARIKLIALKTPVQELQPPATNLDLGRIERLQRILISLVDHPVSELSLSRLHEHLKAFTLLHQQAHKALDTIVELARRRNLPFAGTTEAIKLFQSDSGLPGLQRCEVVDPDVLARARFLAANAWADRSLESIEQNLSHLTERISEAEAALTLLAQAASELGMPFSGSLESLAALEALIDVACHAPQELLNHRQETFGDARFDGVLERAQREHTHEAVERNSLDKGFYLDALPPAEDLRRAVLIFRRGDGLFNFLNSDWRWARRRLSGIVKSRVKRNASESGDACHRIADWMEHRAAFLGSAHFRQYFGTLFNGLETDFAALGSLRAWYRNSQEALLPLGHPFSDLDLTTLPPKVMRLVASRAGILRDAFAVLHELPASMELDLPKSWRAQERIDRNGWPKFLQEVQALIEEGHTSKRWFHEWGASSLTPGRIHELLEAREELHRHREDLELLGDLIARIRTLIGQEMGGLLSESHAHPLADQLGEMERWVRVFRELEELLSPIVSPATTLRAASRYLQARIALGAVLNGAQPSNHQDGWAGYLDWADRLLQHAEALTTLLQPNGHPDLPVATLIGSLEAQAKGDEIEAALDGDADVISLFGKHEEWADAPIEEWACTLEWAERIVKSELPNGLDRALLSDHARVARVEAGRILNDFDQAWIAMKACLDGLTDLGPFRWDAWVTHQICANPLRVDHLVDRIRCALNAIDDVQPLSHYLSAAKSCDTPALRPFATLLQSGALDAKTLPLAFERALYVSIGKEAFRRHPDLAEFAGQSHEKLRAEFQALDAEIIALNGKRIAYEVDDKKIIPLSSTGPRASDCTEAVLIHREMAKTRRHIPIRQLLLRAGKTLQALKPCFMMGPLSVAQYLSHGNLEFDLVVMDEASQLRPEDALGAVIRGKQLIVVGDPKQLPPTSFFDRMVEDNDEEDEALANLEGSESILDICQGLFTPVRTLRWHYRSQHQSLIDFSNFHFYQNSLVVFPSPYERNRSLGVSSRYIHGGVYKDRRNIPEAMQVVEAVFEHMRTTPHESLGVVSLNLTQRDLIQDLFEKRLKITPSVEGFLRTWEEAGSPFFIKNLENVQGDERDVIFISTTFGKSPGATKPYQRFGPISRPEGWRRLNVLFTRSKRRMILFTSLKAEDIVLDESTPRGTRALRDYLEFARRGVLAHVTVTDREPDSDFEISVANVLREHGFEVVPQLGVANFYLDMAVRNPDRRSEFLAGIECDGATYHSSASARDRDRIRQEILENLGWKGRIWRIWSTDWFTSPRREISRLLSFLDTRRQASAQEDRYEELPLEDFYQEATEIESNEEAQEIDSADMELDADQAEDLYAEVGDSITYVFLDKPEEQQEVHICPGQAVRPDDVGESTPLAKAILGSPTGEICVMNSGDRIRSRSLKILKISRN